MTATNACDATPGVGEIRTHAHDRHQPVGVAQRSRAGDQTRNPDVLQPGGQFHRRRQTTESFFG